MFNHLKLGKPIEIRLQRKDCTCYTCARDIHHLGIMSHRAMHRRKREDCKIMYSDGRTFTHNFSRLTQRAPDSLRAVENSQPSQSQSKNESPAVSG